MQIGNQELRVTYLPVNILKPYSSNARTHSKQQIRQIANSIKVFGFVNPVLINHRNEIIAGHGRVAAAELLGIDRVPTILLENLTNDQIRAFMIADNRIPENAEWNQSILAIELQHLVNFEGDFDVTITGFQIPEIDMIIEGVREKQDNDDVFEIATADSQVTHVGDVWQLGKHRVLCGNSLQASSFKTLMGTRKANLVFTDPPYNIKIDGFAGGNGSIHHRDFAMASGEMSDPEFLSFLLTILRLLARHSAVSSIHFVCMDWRSMEHLLAAGRQTYDALLNLCVWTKDNGGMGSFYRSQHELVFVFRSGKGRHLNNVQLGKFGRNRSNVWSYPGVNTSSRKGDERNLLALHPTTKPVSLVADAILDASARGDIVLDAFLGSGTTIVAAERIGRTCFGLEIDPLYVDTAIRRWQRFTGDHAIHAVTRTKFDDSVTASEMNHD